MRYLRERRHALGGALPRRTASAEAVPVPPLESYAAFAVGAEGKEMSTTMAAVRMLANLLRDPVLGPASRRSWPMKPHVRQAALFRQIGIYSPVGSSTSQKIPAPC